jgi:hypothetical protein
MNFTRYHLGGFLMGAGLATHHYEIAGVGFVILLLAPHLSKPGPRE